MDKKTLLLLSFMLIPGVLMLFTLKYNIIPEVWFTSIQFRVGISILSIVTGCISLFLIITKKYKTVDSIYDYYVKKEKNKLSEYIENYLLENNIDSNKIKINEWVEKNYKDK